MDKLAETYKCAWCDNQQSEDDPYLAWDWRVCWPCFNDLERECYEDHIRRKREKELEKIEEQMPERQMQIWMQWFDTEGVSWRCKKHKWQDKEGGLCPSCSLYALGMAFYEGSLPSHSPDSKEKVEDDG